MQNLQGREARVLVNTPLEGLIEGKESRPSAILVVIQVEETKEVEVASKVVFTTLNFNTFSYYQKNRDKILLVNSPVFQQIFSLLLKYTTLCHDEASDLGKEEDSNGKYMLLGKVSE